MEVAQKEVNSEDKVVNQHLQVKSDTAFHWNIIHHPAE